MRFVKFPSLLAVLMDVFINYFATTIHDAAHSIFFCLHQIGNVLVNQAKPQVLFKVLT